MPYKLLFIPKLSKGMEIFITFMFTGHRILKICFMALTSYLLVNEMKVFLIDKPTFTSRRPTKIYPETFPDILICPEQASDLDLLQKFGYRHGRHYGLGRLSDDTLLVTGWLGNQTD